MTEQEKAALIYRCRDAVGHLKQMVEAGIRGGRYSVTEYRYQLMINEIALAALTAEPVAYFILIDDVYQQLADEYRESPDAKPLYAAPTP